MSIYIYKTHVRYQDITDKNELSDKGILNILSEAAGVHSEKAGYSVNQIEETGYAWMILYWKVKVIARPRWNTEITVKTWARSFDKISSWRDFEMYDDKENLIAIGTTQWILVDAKKHTISKITDEIAEKYGMVSKKVFEENLKRKTKRRSKFRKSL